MSASVNAEIALVHYLRGKYRGPKFLRPVPSATDTLTVTVGFEVVNASVNEDDGIATINGFLFKGWTDHNLTWDPSKFGGVRYLRLPPSELFMPDISVIGSDVIVTNDEFLAVVNHEGGIMHIPCVTYKLQANKVSAGQYQVRMTMGSWAHDATRMALKLLEPSGIGLSEFIQGPKWNVTSGGVTVTAKEYNFESYAETFPFAHYLIDFTKKT